MQEASRSGWRICSHPIDQFYESFFNKTCVAGDFVIESIQSLNPESLVHNFMKVIKKRIIEELDQPIDSIFESIDPTPLACASIAQVHSATLRGSQKPVVIKVALIQHEICYKSVTYSCVQDSQIIPT